MPQSENLYTSPHAVTTANISLYFNADTMGEPRTASRGGNILREIFESEFKVFCNATDAQTAIKNEDVLTWYKEGQLQLPRLSRLTTIIFQYLPLKLKTIGTSCRTASGFPDDVPYQTVQTQPQLRPADQCCRSG